MPTSEISIDVPKATKYGFKMVSFLPYSRVCIEEISRMSPPAAKRMAWAHAILLAAGGDILDISSMQTLEYGKKDTILNPYFVAFGTSIDISEVGKIFNEFS